MSSYRDSRPGTWLRFLLKSDYTTCLWSSLSLCTSQEPLCPVLPHLPCMATTPNHVDTLMNYSVQLTDGIRPPPQMVERMVPLPFVFWLCVSVVWPRSVHWLGSRLSIIAIDHKGRLNLSRLGQAIKSRSGSTVFMVAFMPHFSPSCKTLPQERWAATKNPQSFLQATLSDGWGLQHSTVPERHRELQE